MYFKPRDSAFYSFVVALSSVKRYSMTCCLITFAVLVWLFFLYRPLAAQIDYYHNECARLRTQCSEYQSIRKQCCLLEEEVTTLQSEFDIGTAACMHATSSVCIADLVNCIKASDIIITSCAVQEHKKEAWYTQELIAVNGQGTIKQVCSFLEHISQTEHPLSCVHYSITAAGNNAYTISCSYSLYSQHEKALQLRTS